MKEQELHRFVSEKQPNICQIAVSRNNDLVYSSTWNDYRETDCVHVASVTKSIMALLVGIAIDLKQIETIDGRVLDYFPDYK